MFSLAQVIALAMAATVLASLITAGVFGARAASRRRKLMRANKPRLSTLDELLDGPTVGARQS